MKLFDKIKSSPFGSSKKTDTTTTRDATTPQDPPPDESTKNETEPPPPEPPKLRPLHLGTYSFPDGSYAYPPLYDEADSMIKLSNLVYTLIELREIARSGRLDEHPTSLQILEVPLPMDKALSIIGSEAELIKEILSDGAHEQALSALQALAGPRDGAAVETQRGGGMFGLLDMICCPGTSAEASTVEDKNGNVEYTVSTITAVGDEKSNDELVYVVGINPADKRVTVAFRGSTTKADFVTDAKMDMVSVPDPQKFAGQSTDDSEESNVCIHKGFYDYLFGTEKGQHSKYEEIMTHVQTLFDSNPKYRQEYKLYVTGHSLGGALATLFGFYASASTILPGPVTVVSVASPRVGNQQFAGVFTEYESQGKLRHLRIANHRDPVTLGPTVSNKRMLTLGAMAFSPLGYLALKLSGNTAGAEESYYHTGMKMKLRGEVQEDEQRCELSYSGASFLSKTASVGEADDDVIGTKKHASSKWMSTTDVPSVSYHFGRAYAERMASVKDDLAGLTLNELYKTKTAND